VKKIIFILIIVSAAVFSGWLLLNRASSPESRGIEKTATLYQCPMHPQIIQDHPGNCPICGMRLVKVEEQASDAGSADAPQTHLPAGQAGSKKIIGYRNPMDPKVTSSVPAKDSMGMDYIPIYDEPEQQLPTSGVEGHASVRLSADKVRTIGIATEPVMEENLIMPLRFTGTVFYNAAVLEMLLQYRDAIQVEKRYQKPTYERVAQSRAESWVLRNKLRRLGINDEFFKKSEESLNDPTQFVPSSLILQASGAYIDARVPVADLAYVHIGQKAEIYSPMATGEKLEGIVRSIDSVVDFATQTLAVRLEVVSGYEFLKPGMFVTVEMNLDLGKKLSVPATAIFNPGRQAYVFVETEPGVYVPQRVKTGVITSERVEIKSDLKAGEKVVTAANFLLDSESRFQAARAPAQAEGDFHD